MTIIPFAFPHIPGVACAFQTRHGGVSTAPYDQGNISFDVGDDPDAVKKNRTALLELLGVGGWQELKQVHGTRTIMDVQGSDAMRAGEREADGSATRQKNLALAIKTADCQPLLLAHESGEIVAGLHSGWRGNRAEYPVLAVQELCDHYGVKPEEWSAVRGPSLSPARAEFINYDQEWGESFASYHDPATRTMDLWRMTRDQLVRAGLLPHNIFGLDMCTMSMADFFSYRESKEGGRQAACIWMRR